MAMKLTDALSVQTDMLSQEKSGIASLAQQLIDNVLNVMRTSSAKNVLPMTGWLASTRNNVLSESRTVIINQCSSFSLLA
jgi:hypothetical protein